jgi:hypothetical protein
MFHFYHSELYYDYIKFIPLASKLYYQEKTIVSSGVSNTEIHTHTKKIYLEQLDQLKLFIFGKKVKPNKDSNSKAEKY